MIEVVQAARRAIVRVYIDTVDAETHVGLADLERMNHLLGDVLDVEDQHQGLFRGQYTLEVSSPGLDRPLAKKSHFTQAIGQRIKVRTKRRLSAGGRAFTGTLVATSESGIRVAKEEREADEVDLAWDDVEDAQTLFVFETKGAPRPKRQKKRTGGNSHGG